MYSVQNVCRKNQKMKFIDRHGKFLNTFPLSPRNLITLWDGGGEGWRYTPCLRVLQSKNKRIKLKKTNTHTSAQSTISNSSSSNNVKEK